MPDRAVREYILLYGSLTYAQRSEHALRKMGYRARVVRVPASLWKEGCGYGVSTVTDDPLRLAERIKDAGLPPKRMIQAENGRDAP